VLGVLGTHKEEELRAAGVSWVVQSLEDVTAQAGTQGLTLRLKAI
jgi:sugar-phosphatase